MKKSDLYFLAPMMLLAGGTILAFAPDAWLTMMARAFMFQWAILFALLTVVMVWRKQVAMAISSLACLIMVAVQLDHSSPAQRTSGNDHGIRLLHMNVWQPNVRYAEILQQALEEDADIISFQEVDPAWARALLGGLSEKYPYHLLEPRTDCYGIALFSKLPLEKLGTIGMHGSTFIEARLLVNGAPLRVICAHATSPISYDHFRRRNAQLRDLAELLQQDTITTIMVGDLNTVNWDGAFRRFNKRSGMHAVTDPDLRTWPSIGPIALIPLDHIFISPGLGIAHLSHFKVAGSDHRGLLAQISIPPTP